MADVRLTATNPEDSSVVPVACNAKGELKLEEPIEGPKGDKGDKGDKGEDGDPFSGNFADDVTFDGNATFAGGINAAYFIGVSPDARRTGVNPSSSTGPFYFMGTDGDVKFKVAQSGGIAISDVDTETDPKTSLSANGSVTFAGNKAGFTAEGYLWCTTRRGDTVILDVTSNGLASWVPYTPPNRLTELQDKWAEKDGILPVPHESSQDEPEITQ